MVQPEFKTVKQIVSFLKKVKKDVDKLKAKYPNLSILSYSISDLDIDLIYKIEDYCNEGKTQSSYIYHSSGKIKHENDRLTIWSWSKFPVSVNFSSVEVVKDCDCIERKEFKPKVIKETA